jgi:hypothetical protein
MRSFVIFGLVMLGFVAGIATGRFLSPEPPSEVISSSKDFRPKIIRSGSEKGPLVPKIKESQPTSVQSGENLSATSGLAGIRREPEIEPGLNPNHPTNFEPPDIKPPTLAEQLEKKKIMDEMAAGLREQGIPETDIQRIVEGAFPPPPSSEQQYSPYELSAEEKSPEDLKAELEASLREAGLKPEEIQHHVKGMFPESGNVPAPPPPLPPHPSE